MSAQASARRGSRSGGGLGDLELWCVDLAAAGPALREAERRSPRLSDWDRQTAAAMADRQGAAQWLTAHIALRLLLERAVGARWRGMAFRRGPHLRPQLPGATVAFSLAHVDGLALIGLAPEGDIGVDLERERNVRLRAPRREAIEVAGAALGESRPLPEAGNARFLQAWVRLEAFAKAQGCGIGRLLTQLGIVGGRAVAPEVISARVASLRASANAGSVHDLALGSPLFAAVALAPGLEVPPVRWLPARLDGLEKLLA